MAQAIAIIGFSLVLLVVSLLAIAYAPKDPPREKETGRDPSE